MFDDYDHYSIAEAVLSEICTKHCRAIGPLQKRQQRKTLESDMAPEKAITMVVVIAQMKRIQTGAYIYIYTYIHILCICIYIYIYITYILHLYMYDTCVCVHMCRGILHILTMCSTQIDRSVGRLRARQLETQIDRETQYLFTRVASAVAVHRSMISLRSHWYQDSPQRWTAYCNNLYLRCEQHGITLCQCTCSH